MRTTIIMLAGASALASTPTFAQEATTDQFMHRGTQSTMTRDQYLANEAAQLREMGSKGMQWNQLYARWDYVGAAPKRPRKSAPWRRRASRGTNSSVCTSLSVPVADPLRPVAAANEAATAG
jgi:hypothetical protein